jgi:hypothetical protein
MTAPNANVWGTSGIGNGTFESTSTFAPMQQTSSLPPPPGMNARPSQSARISPQSLAQGSRSPSLQQQSLAESHRGFAPPGFGDQFASQMRVNGTSPGPAPVRQPHAPGPIAPPSRAHLQQQQHQQASSQQDDTLNTWQKASTSLPEQYRIKAEEAAEKANQRAGPDALRDDTIRETFKKTSTQQGRLGAPRKYDPQQYTIHDGQGARSVQSLSPTPPHSQTQPLAPLPSTSPLSQDPWQQAGENTVRIPDASLNVHRGSASQQPPIAPPVMQQQQPRSMAQKTVEDLPRPLSPLADINDQSPPPPESSLHPVNGGNAGHPLVRLPPGKPVVKLPPAPASVSPQASVAPQQTVMMPQRPISNWGAPGSSKPIVMQQAWQERFNGLFNRTPIHTEVPPSPPKTPPKTQGPALAVAASSRTVMDEMPAATGATVSLPQAKKVMSPEGFTIDDSSDIISKPTSAEVFTEERSFGSTPNVAVPRHAVYQGAVYRTAAPRPMFTTGPPHRFAVEARSMSEFNIFDLHHRRREGIFVHLPLGKLRNRLVRPPTGTRKPSGQPAERRPSGRFMNGKGKDATSGPPTANEIASNSSQNEATPEQHGPANNAGTPNDTRKKSQWAKPPRGVRRPYTQSRAVTASQ